jgi:aerobic-type carbon monoxide dehydrogenase small subunit (CoxS/CutS family)
MRLTVNDRVHDLHVTPGTTLLELLRGALALPGTKAACTRGECGVCTVLIDGELAYSCVTLAEACAESSVLTVEGLAGTGPSATLAPLQRAFIAHDAAQCGYCTPGQLVAAHALLKRNPQPNDAEIREAMSGNLCRCGTYPKIMSAIRAVALGEFGNAEAPVGS